MRTFLVRVLAGDGRPGHLPLNFAVDADSQDVALVLVHDAVARRGLVVLRIDSIYQVT